MKMNLHIKFDSTEDKIPESINKISTNKLLRYTLYTIGTDLAFSSARNVYCQKVTLKSKKHLETLQLFLNNQNEEYIRNGKNYVYSIDDNCTHLSVNAVSQLGIGKTEF